MNVTVTGLPAIALQIGFVVVFSSPVWLAARIVGARHPTLWRSILSLTAGVVGAFVCLVLTGGWALLLWPLAFLFAFKYVLGTSFPGAVLLAMVAIVGYAAMLHFIGPSFTPGGSSINV